MNDKIELYDIYDLWHVPFWQTKTFLNVCYAIITCFVVLIAYFVYKKWFRKKAIPLTSWEYALQELHDLKKIDYKTKEEGKQFYFKMTAILKNYFSARYLFDVEGKTDQELVSFLKEQDVHQECKECINEIAQGCIYIKFANQIAMQEQIKNHLDLSINMITVTIPETKQ